MSSLLLFLILTIFKTCYSDGIQRNATSVNQTLNLENFISWQSGVANWKNDFITCTQENCVIVCELIASFCVGLSINATASKTLYIRCSIDNACDNLKVTQGPSDNFTIRCIAKSSCGYMDINVMNTKYVNIECNKVVTSTADTTCSGGDIHMEYSNVVNIYGAKGSIGLTNFYVNYTGIINAEFYDWYGGRYAEFLAEHAGELNIKCVGRDACKDARIWCPNDNGKCNIDCIGRDSCGSSVNIWVENRMYDGLTLNCTNLDGYTDTCYALIVRCNDTIYASEYSVKYRTRMTYNEVIPNEWYCGSESWHEPYTCCPFKSDLPTIDCGTGDCVIDCSSMDCRNRKIDGTNTNSIIVNCNTTNGTGYGCQAARIQCPKADGKVCAVNCYEHKSCEYITLQINADQGSRINMECVGNYSCQETSIVFETFYNMDLALTSVSELNMNCIGGHSCRWTVFYIKPYNVKSIDKFSMNCIGDQSCIDGVIDLWSDIGMNELNMICHGIESCKNFVIESEIMSNINNVFNLECNGYASCYDVEIDIYSPGITNISCNNQLSCYSTSSSYKWIFNNIQSDINIICDSKGTATNETGACYHPWYSSYTSPRFELIHAVNSRNMYDVSLFCNSWDCRNTYLGIDYTKHLIIDCQASYSCYSLNIPSNPNLNTLSIDCDNNIGSCIAVNIECPAFYPTSCNISCNNGINLCNNMQINVIDNYRFNYLSLDCGAGSCDDIQFECTKFTYSMISRSAVRYQYDNISEYECNNTQSTACCPWYDNMEQEELNCNAYSNQICNINCSMSTYGDCADLLIDGTAASKLILNCTNFEQCKDSLVICPDGGCDIICNGNSSCNGLRVTYYGDNTDKGSISLICNLDNSCYHTYIYAPYIDYIELKCLDKICQYVVLDGLAVNTMNITCQGPSSYEGMSACSDHYIRAIYANQFNLDCAAALACDSSEYHVENANSVHLQSRGQWGYRSSKLYANDAKSTRIDCAGQGYPDSESCSLGYYYFNEAVTSLHCFGSGCSKLGTLYVNDDISLVDLYWNGCNYCDSLSDCVEYDWKISCDDGDHSEDWSGSYVSSGYGCNAIYLGAVSTFVKNPNHPWCQVNNDIDFMYIPPTKGPTAEPTETPTTSEPTISPTTAEPTLSPTTAQPTASPTTAIPTEVPTTAEPTISPTTAQPSRSPTTAIPTTSEPSKAPITSEPSVSPTTLDPTTVQPTNNPITSIPTTLDPTTSNPTTSVPTMSPITLDPTTSMPTTSDPTTVQPSTSRPTATSDPTTSMPTTSDPSTSKPTGTEQPSTSRPTTSMPTTSDPSTSKPTSTEQPSTSRPTTSMPTTSDPTASKESTTVEATAMSYSSTQNVLATERENVSSTAQATPDIVDGVSMMDYYVSVMWIVGILFVVNI